MAKGKHTEVTACTVLQLAALDNLIKGPRQHSLVLGIIPWTKRDLLFLNRVRAVRGLNVIESHRPDGVFVTIFGTLLPGGFTKIIGDCQKLGPSGV